MAKKMETKKKQIAALIIAAILSIVAFSIYLFREEIYSIFKDNGDKIAEEAGWTDDIPMGADPEQQVISSIAEKGENVFATDAYGNQYVVRYVPALKASLPVLKNEEWSYSLFNDVLYYNCLEDCAYKDIQIAVIPIKNSTDSLYKIASDTDKYISNGLIYKNSVQHFRCIRMQKSMLLSETSLDDRLLEYHPSITFKGIKYNTEFESPYCDLYYIRTSQQVYAVIGVGNVSQSDYVNELTHTISAYIDTVNASSSPSPIATKTIKIDDHTISLPQTAIVKTASCSVTGVLSEDPFMLESGLAYYIGFISNNSDTYIQKAIFAAYLSYMGVNISDNQEYFFDKGFSSYEISNDNLSGGGNKTVIEILSDKNSYDIYRQSTLAPVRVNCIISPINGKSYKCVVLISNSNLRDESNKYIEKLLSSIR